MKNTTSPAFYSPHAMLLTCGGMLFSLCLKIWFVFFFLITNWSLTVYIMAHPSLSHLFPSFPHVSKERCLWGSVAWWLGRFTFMAHRFGFESRCYHVQAAWPWRSCGNSLSLSFPIWKTRIAVPPTSYSCGKERRE